MRMIYSQLREKHPLLQMMERCLDFPEDRPSIGEVLRLLEQARAEDRDEQTEMNKLELLQALQRNQPRNQVRERVCLIVMMWFSVLSVSRVWSEMPSLVCRRSVSYSNSCNPVRGRSRQSDNS